MEAGDPTVSLDLLVKSLFALGASNRELAATYVKEHGRFVKDVMSRSVISVAEETTLGEIADLFERGQIKRVPVLRDGKLAGIASRANLIRALACEQAPIPGAASPDDKAIRAAIFRELGEQRWVMPRQNVIVKDGIVHLWGVIDSEEERRAISIAAEGVPGVRGVASHFEYPPLIPATWG